MSVLNLDALKALPATAKRLPLKAQVRAAFEDIEAKLAEGFPLAVVAEAIGVPRSRVNVFAQYMSRERAARRRGGRQGEGTQAA